MHLILNIRGACTFVVIKYNYNSTTVSISVLFIATHFLTYDNFKFSRARPS